MVFHLGNITVCHMAAALPHSLFVYRILFTCFAQFFAFPSTGIPFSEKSCMGCAARIVAIVGVFDVSYEKRFGRWTTFYMESVDFSFFRTTFKRIWIRTVRCSI